MNLKCKWIFKLAAFNWLNLIDKKYTDTTISCDEKEIIGKHGKRMVFVFFVLYLALSVCTTTKPALNCHWTSPVEVQQAVIVWASKKIYDWNVVNSPHRCAFQKHICCYLWGRSGANMSLNIIAIWKSVENLFFSWDLLCLCVCCIILD